MIDTERIYKIWEKSPRVPQFPPPLKDIITLSFQKKVNQKTDSIQRAFIQGYKTEILTVLQSPLYRLQKNVKTVRDMINSAGLEIIRNLLVVFWMQKLKAAGKYERIDYARFHRQNLVSALFARHLTRHFRFPKAEQIFLQSYLQDVSLLMLSRTLPELYDALMNLNDRKRFDPAEEKKIIGTDHGQLSGWILEQWGFPAEFIQPVAFHHPDRNLINSRPEFLKEVYLIHFSQLMAAFILHTRKELKYTRLEQLFQQYFQQAPDELAKLTVDVIHSLPQLAPLFGFSDLADISVIGILKQNPGFLAKKLLPYEELVEEVTKAQQRVEVLENELEMLRNQLEHNQFRDSITGLYNHTYFREFLAQEIRKAVRYEYPISLLICDIDQFQLFNQTYGYRVGNHILSQLGELLGKNLRESDVLARFGSDEFAIMLPHAGIPQARFVAQKICKLIDDYPFSDLQSDRQHHITVSIGFATLMPSISLIQENRLIRMASDALEQCKSRGGNCCYHPED